LHQGLVVRRLFLYGLARRDEDEEEVAFTPEEEMKGCLSNLWCHRYGRRNGRRMARYSRYETLVSSFFLLTPLFAYLSFLFTISFFHARLCPFNAMSKQFKKIEKSKS